MARHTQGTTNDANLATLDDGSVATHRDFHLVWICDEFLIENEQRLFEALRRRSKDRRFRHLAQFLDNAVAVLREELSKVEHDLSVSVPPFTNILDLLICKDLPPLSLGGSFKHFLLVVLHIALYIGSQEDEAPKDRKQPSVLASLSAGMLSAAAIAVASSVADLATVGAECARVAFRIGICIQETSRLLEPAVKGACPESWAYVVATSSASADEVHAEICAFDRETNNQGLTQLYVSADDDMSVVVTGPPSRLKRCFETSARLRTANWAPLPVFDGLAHGPHLYDAQAVANIVQPLQGNALFSNEINVPVLSSTTGQIFPATDGYDLLAQVTSAILTRSIHVDAVRNGIVQLVSSSEESAIQCSLFESSKTSGQVIDAIQLIPANPRVEINDLVAWTKRPWEMRIPRSPSQSKLAVVGMSCRMPGGANSPQLLWNLLREGKSTCTTVPPDRFDLEQHFDPTGTHPNTTSVQFGNFIDNPGLFDAGFFNLSPREANNTDPAARLALVCAYEALEMAGFTPNRTRSTMLPRVGTYLGQASDDWRELNASQDINAFIVPGGVRAFANGRINYFFKFGGPSFNIDTACSSGLAAVQAACSALWANEVDTAIAGGVNIITDPDNYCGLGQAGFLSKSGQCKVWDETADGYCRADGIGTVVIKRLEDAEADNDNVLAVILSGATNHSAFAPSITHPHAGAQVSNYINVVRDAGIDPLDVTFAELHGTGTQAGDAIEAESIERVFAPARPRREPNQTLYLGAVKSNIGHGEAAAGIASMIKVLLCYQHDMIPANIGIETKINPNISQQLLGPQGAVLVQENTRWPRPMDGHRLAVVNSFGAHGGNTTLLLDDAPVAVKVKKDPRNVYPVLVSAKSNRSLLENLRRLRDFLLDSPGMALGDLSYTLCARRMHHNYRVGTTSSSVTDVISWLESTLAAACAVVPRAVDAKKIVFVFTGQGSFYQDMAAELLRDCAIFRQEVARLNRIVVSLGCSPVLTNANSLPPGNETPTSTTAQLTIVVVEIALANLLAKLEVRPSMVLGHSLGEYAALVVAGVISAADALMIVVERGRLLQRRCATGDRGMLKIQSTDETLGVETVQNILHSHEDLEWVCINSGKSWVIGGGLASLARAQIELEGRGLGCTKVHVPFAFHTSQMDCILNEFGTLLGPVSFNPPQIPYISPIMRRAIEEPGVIDASYLQRACRETVDQQAAIDDALTKGLLDANTLFVEVGPHPIVLRCVQEMLPKAKTFATLSRTEPCWTTLTRALAGIHNEGVSVNWAEHFSEYEKAHSLCHLPSYAWNERTHWISYTGGWTLQKASSNQHKRPGQAHSTRHPLSTGLIHQILEEDIQMGKAAVVFCSDLAHPTFQKVMNGHIINKHGVASWVCIAPVGLRDQKKLTHNQAVYYDMALAAGEYVFDRLEPSALERRKLTVVDLQCFEPQLLAKSKKTRQLIRLEARLGPDTRSLHLGWYSIQSEETRPAEPYAIGTVIMDDTLPSKVVSGTLQHLVLSRIAALDEMATKSTASRLHKAAIYRAFENIVEYATEYEGMESLVISGYEAYAHVRLNSMLSEQYHTSPCWTDSLCQIAGFVMNAGEHCDFRNEFWVTPGFDSLRLTRPLQAGATYRSYVKMAPTAEPRLFAGDIFIISDDQVIALVEQVKFRQFPRVLMDQFFSLPYQTNSDNSGRDNAARKASTVSSNQNSLFQADAPSDLAKRSHAGLLRDENRHGLQVLAPSKTTTASSSDLSTLATPASEHWLTSCFIELVAAETGLNETDFDDERRLADLGIDSMVALVLSTKLRAKTGIDAKHSAMLEQNTIGEVKRWLVSNS